MKTIQSLIISAATLSAALFGTKTIASNASKIYVYESDANGFNTNTLFYDDGKEVVAFDAQFTVETAQKAIDFIKSKTKNPIKYLVVTHPNPDKFNGIPAFKKEGAKVIMSDLTSRRLKEVHEYKKYYFVNMAKMFTEDTYPKLPSADITFDDQYEIKMANGGVVLLKELKKNCISANLTVAYLKKENALYVGDLVHNKTHAWLEGPVLDGNTNFDKNSWILALETVKNMYPKNVIVYGGRGKEEVLSTSIDAEISYLNKANEIVSKYVNGLQGSTLEEKKSNVNYNDLTDIFKTTFPTYAYPYMVTYGAYGVVNSIK